MTIDGIKLNIRNNYIRTTSSIRRRNINNYNFTIISNNCWGGLVYEAYGLEKQSPTVGMFFMADEYLKFISNLRYYVSCKMEFVEPQNSWHKDFYERDRRFGSYPIARLDDVEIALLHFGTEEDAKNKWLRRCERINWDKLIVKMNDQNQCKREHAEQFLKMAHKNKLFFTVHKDWLELNKDMKDASLIYIPSKNTECCGLFDEPINSIKKFNLNKFINEL